MAVIVEEHGGPEVLRWQARALPQRGPGQVRVRVEATGVNYADVLSRRGGYGPGAPLPFVPGLDAAGTVDRHAQDFVALTLELTGGRGADVILDSVSGETAERGLIRVPKNSVTCYGIFSTRGRGKRDGFPGIGLEQRRRRGTSGAVPDVTEMDGIRMSCLARFGRLVTYGHAGGRPGLIPTAPLHREGRAVIGYSGSTLRQHRPEQARAVAQAALGALARGEVHLHGPLPLPLAEAEEAHQLVEAGQVRGRLTLLA
ncbi:hypothetical protein C8263_13735 [Deinococcus arcticus]|uniref:Enoyl reductase (ER) domain-containing protein n=1 Tax=Deinococcus arcticus TaxID=2136176 RepID=A0A2T3W636_9DEIO|nr:hypothetical protein C8263_13735 [Deinococcus arcticus]